jgi:hypothetical protein
MPTFRQRAFIPRALASVLGQTFTDWELVVVDDGSPDDTHSAVIPFLADHRISYQRLDRNRGLGNALNSGLEHGPADLIAYLPSDDVWHADHLETLVDSLERHADAVLAFAGVRHGAHDVASGQIVGEPLQLAQVLHRRTSDRWVERETVTTDDLDRMMWTSLRERGTFVGTGRVTCEWVDHPLQRHKMIRESATGGLNTYRSYHTVPHPLRFESSIGNRIDEVAQYRRFRDRPTPDAGRDGLKILIVGELAFNPERVLALRERGHRLYGLWTPTPADFTTVGPVPFGGVEDIPREGWQETVRRVKPDIIYGLLNWHAVPWVHHVLTENPGVPFVWHFKEGPFFCLQKGTWPLLADLHSRSDGRIYASPELCAWFDAMLPNAAARPSMALDGDLPKRDWFDGEFSRRLSEDDGEIHTVLPGRPMGIEPATVGELARNGIHLHFYGEVFQRLWKDWIDEARRLAPRHLHLHGQADQDSWVSEFSKYDAGWLHTFASNNAGDIRRATWDDLNYPARLGTLAAAGLPLIQRDNSGSIVATQTLARNLDIGVFFRDLADLSDLGAQLRDQSRMRQVRAHVATARDRFTFDHHADDLVSFFRHVIAGSATAGRDRELVSS